MTVFNRTVLELDDEFEYSLRICHFIIPYRNYCKRSSTNTNYTGFTAHERSLCFTKTLLISIKKNRSPLLKQIILISFLTINIIKSSNLAKYLQNKTI